MRWLPVVVLVGCVPSAAELCQRGVDFECAREFECQSDAVKGSEGFKGGWGTSVEDCSTRVAKQARCAEKVTQSDLCTGADQGKTFDLGAAQACSGARKALSCADFLDPAKLPESCAQKCR
ncbi:MAG: hypothetical protein IPJ65_43790 [Archangiaceae bacterium]|nr:hypothetical protein [Archangiaceae bacterium]